jgi:hypothetical protein
MVAESPCSSGSLGDWYANLLYIDRQQFILAVSEKTLLPLLISAKDAKLFPQRLRESLAESLDALKHPKRKN